jgi:endonuclease YncB( thermonuclease family)
LESFIKRHFLFAALVAFTAAANAAEFSGRVVGVADGDTVTVLDGANEQHRIRLAGIDAPEKRQPYGEHAKQHLSNLVYGKNVLVVWDKRDRYGRIVGRVLAPECDRSSCRYAIDAGLEQLKAGLAWHYKQYEKEQPVDERVRYSTSERDARARREGLWRDNDALPPWQFRHPTSSSAQTDRIASIAP